MTGLVGSFSGAGRYPDYNMATKKTRTPKKNGNGNGNLESLLQTGMVLAMAMIKIWEQFKKMQERKKEKTIHGKEIQMRQGQVRKRIRDKTRPRSAHSENPRPKEVEQ